MAASAYAQRVVILTGASRGIGLASLSILLRRGVRVVAMSRTETPELVVLKSEYPESLIVCQGDVAKDEDNKVSLASLLLRSSSVRELIGLDSVLSMSQCSPSSG